MFLHLVILCNTMVSSPTLVMANIRTSFPVMSGSGPLCTCLRFLCVFNSWWIHRIILYLAIINKTAMKQRMHIALLILCVCLFGFWIFSFCLFCFCLLAHILKSMVFFNIVKGIAVLFFYGDCTKVHAKHQCARAPLSRLTCQHHLPLVFVAGILPTTW